MQINSGTVLAIPMATWVTNRPIGCMMHMAPSDSCFLAPDLNTLTYLLTVLSTRVLDKIFGRVFEQ